MSDPLSMSARWQVSDKFVARNELPQYLAADIGLPFVVAQFAQRFLRPSDFLYCGPQTIRAAISSQSSA
jgi:hypothetical protein